jgi:hypothetical protein
MHVWIKKHIRVVSIFILVIIIVAVSCINLLEPVILKHMVYYTGINAELFSKIGDEFSDHKYDGLIYLTIISHKRAVNSNIYTYERPLNWPNGHIGIVVFGSERVVQQISRTIDELAKYRPCGSDNGDYLSMLRQEEILMKVLKDNNIEGEVKCSMSSEGKLHVSVRFHKSDLRVDCNRVIAIVTKNTLYQIEEIAILSNQEVLLWLEGDEIVDYQTEDIDDKGLMR